jgi:hypothetical protein
MAMSMMSDVMNDDGGTTTSDEIERLIGEEVDKRNPRPAARNALVLMALGRVDAAGESLAEGTPFRGRILDEKGQRRTRVEDGQEVDLTIADLVTELQQQHPRLFDDHAGETPVPLRSDERDWLLIAPASEEPPPGPVKSGSAIAAWIGEPRRFLQRAQTKVAATGLRLSSKPAKRSVAHSDEGTKPSRYWKPLAATLLIPAIAVAALLVFKPLEKPSRLSSASEPLTTGTANKSAASTQVDKRPPAFDSVAALPSVSGVPEVIDTTTLKIGDEVVHLYGVEWARGGNADQLRSYLGDRVVSCRQVSDAQAHRCEVDGRDLSVVVLFNGGARATPQAPAEFRTAEQYARLEGRGVWKR